MSQPMLFLFGGSSSATGMVTVGEGEVSDGRGDGVRVAGTDVPVGEAGGVTRKSNCWLGKITDAALSPFQFIKSESGTS